MLTAIAYQHQGHRNLEAHFFIQSIKSKSATIVSVLQYLYERFCILQAFESILRIQVPCFINSTKYLLDYQEIMIKYQVTDAVISVIEKQSSISTRCFIHEITCSETPLFDKQIYFWLFITGDTFGTKHINQYIRNAFPQYNLKMKNSDTYPQPNHQIRILYNDWISDEYKQSGKSYTKQQLSDIIGHAYKKAIQMMDSCMQSTNNKVRPDRFARFRVLFLIVFMVIFFSKSSADLIGLFYA